MVDIDGERELLSKVQSVILVVMALAVVLAASFILERHLQVIALTRPFGGDLQHLVWGYECPNPADIKIPEDESCLSVTTWNPVLQAVIGLAPAAYALFAPRFGVGRVRAIAVLVAVILVAIFGPDFRPPHFPGPELGGGASTWSGYFAELRGRTVLKLGRIAAMVLGGTLVARYVQELSSRFTP